MRAARSPPGTREPGPGQIRIAVQACGLNPADWHVVNGLLADRLPPLPRGLGFEIAGTVDALGEGVTGVGIGDRVFGPADFHGPTAGAAEYAVMPAWARIPEGLTAGQAAALPMAAETELQERPAGRRAALQAASDPVRGFAVMITQLTGQGLSQWTADAEAPWVAWHLLFRQRPGTRLRCCHPGLTSNWSSGPVEGTRQPHQDDQAPDVQPGLPDPAPQPGTNSRERPQPMPRFCELTETYPGRTEGGDCGTAGLDRADLPTQLPPRVAGASTAVGTKVELWDCSGGTLPVPALSLRGKPS